MLWKYELESMSHSSDTCKFLAPLLFLLFWTSLCVFDSLFEYWLLFDTFIVFILPSSALQSGHFSPPFTLLLILTCFDCPTLPLTILSIYIVACSHLTPAQASVTSLLSLVKRPTFLANFVLIHIFLFFLLHLAAHSGCCFCCCSGYLNSYYDSYSVREAH